MSVIKVENLGVKSIGGDWLLKPLSFRVSIGQLVGVIGGSGSGKSILADALMGTAPKGFELIGSVSISSGKLSLAAQSSSVLDPLRTVAKQLKRRFIHKSRRFKNIGISDQLGRYYPHQLSGGMAKRVLLAQALVQERPFVIADEPCCGLDAVSSQNLYQHFRELADNGRGILVISHNLRELCAVADVLIVLRNGELVEIIKPDAITSNTDSYSHQLWQALPENW